MHPSTAAILVFFEYDHLPPKLQAASKPFYDLAHKVAKTFDGPELIAGLRKLLEAKDCIVRAAKTAETVPSDPRGMCRGGCGRKQIDGKATCGDARCGSTTGPTMNRREELREMADGVRKIWDMWAKQSPENFTEEMRRNAEAQRLRMIEDQKTAASALQVERAPARFVRTGSVVRGCGVVFAFVSAPPSYEPEDAASADKIVALLNRHWGE